eukprot:COSAG06_NODE_60228_length_271_cov_1.186047_1_plen_82_part_10
MDASKLPGSLAAAAVAAAAAAPHAWPHVRAPLEPCLLERSAAALSRHGRAELELGHARGPRMAALAAAGRALSTTQWLINFA